jgi:hypothetical protein
MDCIDFKYNVAKFSPDEGMMVPKHVGVVFM